MPGLIVSVGKHTSMGNTKDLNWCFLKDAELCDILWPEPQAVHIQYARSASMHCISTIGPYILQRADPVALRFHENSSVPRLLFR